MEILIFTLGLVIGSFINMLIFRIPNNISLFNPTRSICPKCNAVIKWYENIPLLSFLFLKGRCSNCHTNISILYPIVELLSGFVTLLIFQKIGFDINLIFALIFFYTLILLSFIDLRYKEVPDYLLLILFIFSFFVSDLGFLNSLQYGLILAGGFAILNFLITFYIQNIKAKLLKNKELETQEALGEGDIPVIAAIGIILGLQNALAAIFLSAIFAIIPAIYNSFIKKDIEIPFIPFLALGLFCVYIFEDQIKNIIGLLV